VRSRRANSELPPADRGSRLQRRPLRRWWLNLPVRAKGLIVIAVPLIALIGTTSASLALQYREGQQRTAATASSNLGSAGDLVLADAVNAESGIRGYVATGDPVFLDPYNLALARIGAERSSLRHAAIAEGDNREQRLLSVTTGKVLRQLAQLRSATRAGINDRSLHLSLLNTKATMDLLRRQVAALIAGPAALTITRRKEIVRLATAIDVVDIAGLVLGLLAGLVGVALFTSGISRRLAVAAANAARLGAAEALEPVDPWEDELGRLALSLAQAEEHLAVRAARQYRPRLALLAAIVDSSDDAIVSKSVDGLITSWNRAAERMYGYSADEIVGRHVSLLLEADLRSEEAEIRGAFIRRHSGQGEPSDPSHQGSLRHETMQLRKDGTTFPAALTLSAVYDDDGTMIGVSSIGRDITAPRRAAAELRSRMDDLEEANHNMETFTYSVSHDLRTPLRTLSGFSTALLEEYRDVLGEVGRDYAERIGAAAERMGQLIDDLLQLSRLWRTAMHDVKAVDLSAEVTAIAADLQRGEPDRGVRFAIQDAVWAPADRVLIRTVLENLLGNAWKFTSGRQDASIEFGTTQAEDAPVCCYVRDNGAGFDPAYVHKLFQPFQRLHTMREFPGTGVGLASVRQIVERHGGRVWAEGAAGHGATFYFTLDAKAAA
jgi:PAS domain S-box-containing protein